MKKLALTLHAEPEIEIAIRPAQQPSPFLQLAAARARRDEHDALAWLPRRQLSPADRAAVAAAEQAAWDANGGDFLLRPTAAQRPRPVLRIAKPAHQ